MDPVSTAPSAVWLDALRRAQSPKVQRLHQVAPQTQPDHSARTLADIIESGLKHGGAAPLSADATAVTNQGRKVDLLV